ncbi:MAG: hypothetical protein ABSD31_12000 [Candidatus Binataceae bacterium]
MGCDTGLKPPLTLAEIAQGGTKSGSLTLPSSLPNPYPYFLGNGWIQPGSFALYSDEAETTMIASDNGNGVVTGSAVAASPPASTMNYAGGLADIYFNNSEAGATIYSKYTHVGTDGYDVSMVDGFNVPIEVSPTVPSGGHIPNAAEVAAFPEPCVYADPTPVCAAGLVCASNNQCVKECKKDADCGQYPSRCDTTLATPICVNTLETLRSPALGVLTPIKSSALGSTKPARLI